MNGKRARLGAMAIVGILWVAALPASAKTVLTGTLTDAVCGIRGSNGLTSVDCRTFSDSSTQEVRFEAELHRGDTAFVTATLHYEYRDDGLPLINESGMPFTEVVYSDPEGFNWVTTYREAGAILPFSNLCEHARYCPRPPGLYIDGSGFPPVLLGWNDTPDHITGQMDLFSSVTIGSEFAVDAATFDVFAGWSGMAFSSPIPEPGSLALVAAGLIALRLRAWR